MRAHEIGLGMDQSHYILQLVAKTECAAGLVKGAARPYPACQGLVYEPAVGLYVQGLIGRLDAHGAQSVDPVLRDFFQGGARGRRAVETLDEVQRFDLVPAGPQFEHDFVVLAVGQFERNLYRRARIERRARGSRERCRTHGRGPFERAVATDEFGSVRCHGAGIAVYTEESIAVAELHAVGIARDDGGVRSEEHTSELK